MHVRLPPRWPDSVSRGGVSRAAVILNGHGPQVRGGASVLHLRRPVWAGPVLKLCLFMPQLSHDLTRLKAHCEEKVRGLVASTVGAVEGRQLQRRRQRKVVWLFPTAAGEAAHDGQAPGSAPLHWSSVGGRRLWLWMPSSACLLCSLSHEPRRKGGVEPVQGPRVWGTGLPGQGSASPSAGGTQEFS